MRSRQVVATAVAATLTFTCVTGAVGKPPANQVAAVADTTRPKADRDRDALHKAVEALEYADVEPGQVTVDLLPGGGYFTRLFSRAVGPDGVVYSVRSVPLASGQAPGNPSPASAITPDASYQNVTVMEADLATLRLPRKADLFWTSKGYWALYREGGDLPKATAKALYANLKPGGAFVILEQAASAGMPLEDQLKLHRIDPAVIKADMLAAGFRYEGESKLFANASDDHTKITSDPSLGGAADQFLYTFRKPK